MDKPSPSRSVDAQFRQEEEKARGILLQNYLNGSLILGTIIFFVNLYSSMQAKNLAASVIIVLLFGTLFLSTFVRTLSLTAKTNMLAGVVFCAGIYSLVTGGLNSLAILYFLLAVLLIGILIEGYWWIIGLLVSGITVSLVGVLIQSGIIRQGSYIIENNSLLYWLSVLIIFLFMVFVIVAPLNQYLSITRKRIIELDKNEHAIAQDNQNLTDRVLTLETEIDRRQSRMIATQRITREISQQTSVEKLLSDSVEFIRTQMGFYYAGIFLVDENNEFAVLKAASGSVGKSMLDENYQVRIHDEGIIGSVLKKGEPRVALDLQLDSNQHQSSILPETQSELCVPLRVGRTYIGVLDIQSENKNAFSVEDVEVFQIVADQIAASFDKNTQISQLRHRTSELEQGYGVFTRGVWRTHLKGSKRPLKFTSRENKVSSKSNALEFEKEVLRSGKSILAEGTQESSQNPESILSVPIKLREQVLGVINIRYKGKKVPPSLISLVETATNRLAVTLENARLLEEIQDRAEQEHTVSEISSKVRAAQDIDTILQTAVVELGKTLGVDEVSIKLKTTDSEKQQ